MKKNPLIQIVNAHKYYQLGDTAIHALQGVSLEIAQGESVFLGGPSGSGKSTLLHIIGCLDNLDEGNVIIDNINIADSSNNQLSDFRAENIGFVFQSFNLIPVLNVYENIEYPLILKREKNRKKKINAKLVDVGLENFSKHFPNELSGGQRQRVAIARALVVEPQILIADEPTANLDSKTGDQVIKLMLDLAKKQGSLVIICTHNEKLLSLAERVVMLEDGKIVSDSAALEKLKLVN